MNRNRFVHRQLGTEGDENGQRFALALAQLVPAEFLERLLAHVAALNEFGGQVYVAAVRDRFNDQGEKVEQGGAFETWGYAVAYDSKQPPIRGQVAEDDSAPLAGVEIPDLSEPEEAEPEPVAVGAESEE